jgi:NAD(P)-dependent dehydrogenase (short-subunit alcohol dehydrogenase family)
MQFAREGGKVAVVDLNEQHGKETVQEIIRTKGAAVFAKCDVGNPENVKAAIRTAVHKWKKMDVVANDAAMMTFKPIVDLRDEDFDTVLNVNLRSVFLLCKYSVPHMPKGSAIVNISSVRAYETTKNVVPCQRRPARRCACEGTQPGDDAQHATESVLRIRPALSTFATPAFT